MTEKLSTAARRPRTGLENRQDRMEKATFWQEGRGLLKLHHEIMDSNLSDAHVQGGIVEHLWQYAELSGGETEKLDPEKEYARYATCIAGALKSLDTYAHTMLVEDILQRLTVKNEWVGVSDPMRLLDGMVTTRDPRTRFELRRALHLGAMFYEFEKIFGTEQELYERLHEFEMFLDAMVFKSSKSTDATLIHTLRDDTSGEIAPTGIRIPLFDHSDPAAHLGENQVFLSFRQCRDNPDLRVVVKERLKSRWSAVIKCIREGRSLRSLTDVEGITFFIDDTSHGQLDNFIELFEGQVPAINPKDRIYHRLRGGVGRDENNPSSSDRYSMETVNVNWTPGTLLKYEEDIQQTLQQLYQSPRLQQAFWRGVHSHGDMFINIESKFGTLRDMVDYTLTGGDENHEVYKADQAGRSIKGDERNVLRMLFPKAFVGIDLTAPHIQRILREKQLASIGLHPKVMQQIHQQMGTNRPG